MPTNKGWEDFDQNIYWRDLVADVKARMLLIQQDLFDEDIAVSLEDIRALQREYKTCLWFINLPKLRMEEKGNEDGS